MLENPDWKYDEVPEIMDGKNIADFVDPDILNRLDELEKEEQMLEEQRANQMDEESMQSLSEEMEEAYGEVKNKQALKKIEHNMKKRNRTHGKNQDASFVAENMEEKGIPTEKFMERMKKQRKVEKMSELVKRKHAALESDEDKMVDEADEGENRARRNFENRKRS